MAKVHLSTPVILIGSGVLAFLLLIGTVFYITYRLGQKAKLSESEQLAVVSRGGGDEDQQIRRIRFTDQLTGESTEITMDGTVNQYDKTGKLIKTGRRGFAETQYLFKKFEWLINSGKKIDGGNYQIEIETEEGTIIVNPGGDGSNGGDEIDDAIDFIDDTINPTPTPRPTPNPSGSTPTPYPNITPSPTPLPDAPDYLTAPPFNCDDYYTSGKRLKISDIICGPEPSP